MSVSHRPAPARAPRSPSRSATPPLARWIRRELAGRAAARHVADRHGLGRRDRAARRRGRAAGPDPAASPRSASTSGWCARACSAWRAKAGSKRDADGRRSRYRLTREGARRFDAGVPAHLCPRPSTTGTAPGSSCSSTRLPPARARARCARSSRGQASASLAPGSSRARASRRALPSRDRASAADSRTASSSFRARDDAAAGRPHAGLRGRRGRGTSTALAADYRRFLQRFGAVIERFRAPRPNARPGAMLRRAHAADPRVPPRAAARSAAARRAAAARLAGRRRLRAVPRFLPAHAPRAERHSRRRSRRGRAAAARAPGVLRPLRRARATAAAAPRAFVVLVVVFLVVVVAFVVLRIDVADSERPFRRRHDRPGPCGLPPSARGYPRGNHSRVSSLHHAGQFVRRTRSTKVKVHTQGIRRASARKPPRYRRCASPTQRLAALDRRSNRAFGPRRRRAPRIALIRSATMKDDSVASEVSEAPVAPAASRSAAHAHAGAGRRPRSGIPFRVVLANGAVAVDSAAPAFSIIFRTARRPSGGSRCRATSACSNRTSTAASTSKATLARRFAPASKPAATCVPNPVVRLRNRWHEWRFSNARIAQAKANARFHYGLGTAFYRLWLDAAGDDVHLRLLEGRHDDARGGAAQQDGPRLPQGAARRPARRSSTSAAASAASCSTPGALRRARHRHQHDDRAGRLSCAREIARRGLADKLAVRRRRLPRDAAASTTSWCRSACSSTPGRDQLAEVVRAHAESLKPGGLGMHAFHRPRRRAATPSSTSASTCSPAAGSRAWPRRSTAMERCGLEVVDVENLRRHYALTLDAWAERFDAQLGGDPRARPAALRRALPPHLAHLPLVLRRDVPLAATAARTCSRSSSARATSAASYPMSRAFLYRDRRA